MAGLIYLTQGKVTIVDDEDYEALSAHKWFAYHRLGLWYARRNIAKPGVPGKQSGVSIHRTIMGVTDRLMFVDHVNGDGLDNRRSNLRIATCAQNQANRHRTTGLSRFKGVTWDTRSSAWRVRLTVATKRLHFGRFDSELDAARAYDAAAELHHGEFASLNRNLFPDLIGDHL